MLIKITTVILLAFYFTLINAGFYEDLFHRSFVIDECKFRKNRQQDMELIGNHFATATENPALKFLDFAAQFLGNYTSDQCHYDTLYVINASNAYAEASQKTCLPSNCMCQEQKELEMAETAWTQTLSDSYGIMESYLQQGNIYWLGGYDECISISSTPNISSGDAVVKFKGKYCLQSKTTLSKKPSKCNPNDNTTYVSIPMQYGVCIPDSCFAGNINEQRFSVDYYGLTQINFSLTCHEPLDISTDTRAISMMIICALFALILICGTIYELWIYREQYKDEYSKTDFSEKSLYNQLSYASKALLCFSVINNSKKIFSTQKVSGQLDCIHGIRFLSLSWVILGHTYIFAAGFIDNILAMYKVLYKLPEQTILNATFSVDTFFVLSGLLLTYLWLKETEKQKGRNLKSVTHWIMYYVHRFIRLTPPYMLLMGMDICLMRYLADGPLWPQAFGFENNFCKKTWWTNLLYVNNFVYADTMCFGWAWYLAVDMQLHWIAPLVLIPLYLFPLIGIAICVALVVGSSVAVGVVTYINNYAPNQLTVSFNDAQFNTGIDVTLDIYYKPYMRAGPFFIGMIVGYCLFKCRGHNFKINKFFNAACWILAAVLNLTVLYGMYNVATGHVIDKVASAMYSGVARSVWGLGVGWLIFACVTGNGGFVNKFLSLPVFVPLSRLTYCAYLIHPLVLMWVYFSRETAIHFDSDFTLVYFYFGHLVLAYSLAYIASLAFESPFVGLMKLATDDNRQPLKEKKEENVNIVFVNDASVNGSANEMNNVDPHP